MENSHDTTEKRIADATLMTRASIQHTLSSLPIDIESLSELDLPEIERIANEVARIVPAGNVPGIILGGLAMLNSRTIDRTESQKYVNLLFKGARMTFDKAIYGTFFAGPAAIIYGYQQLLKLTGKDLDSAFPDGTWQFYLEFALREDSARHTNETTGFNTNVSKTLNEADQLACWLLSVAQFVIQMPEILKNEWRERVLIRVLAECLADQQTRTKDAYLDAYMRIHRELYRNWETLRPYHRTENMSHPQYRREVFDAYWERYYKQLRRGNKQKFKDKLTEWEEKKLDAYQQQMTWLATLTPGDNQENRQPYDISQANIGVIYHGVYHLVPLQRISEPETARRFAYAVINQPKHMPASLDDVLVRTPRANHKTMTALLDDDAQKELELLEHTPILINWDEQSGHKRISEIRQAKRGIGSHALTLMRTTNSMVFDQSHIFFDGAWGASVAQVLTNEALMWAKQISKLPENTTDMEIPHCLELLINDAIREQASNKQISTGISAENQSLKMNSIIQLRKMLKQRTDLALITVNDLFILYRGIHAQTYEPSSVLKKRIELLAASPRESDQKVARLVNDAFKAIRSKNPALLIPIDGSKFDPRERIYPMTFRNPITDFMRFHNDALEKLRAMEANPGDNTIAREFEEARRNYLGLVGGFGKLLTRYTEIAISGGSTSTGTIKFLAHMPPGMQKLLNQIPGRFDVLNEVIKGEEVFSNTGRVAVGSTLRRFITAKDDNEQKTLAWGVQTDDNDIVHFSLRDFRPHVDVLISKGYTGLAQHIAQDYLDSYIDGLNQYTRELRQITVARGIISLKERILGR